MARKFSTLQQIEHNETITEKSHHEFLYLLRSALLLALREQGRLSPMQHRHAEELLRQQRRDRARQMQEVP